MIKKLIDEGIVNNANDAYELHFTDFMNWLCYIKDRDDLIKEQEDRQKNTITT